MTLYNFHMPLFFACSVQKLVHIAPRKMDWDLKRDIAKKLEKLRRRTNRAIAEIARGKNI